MHFVHVFFVVQQTQQLDSHKMALKSLKMPGRFKWLINLPNIKEHLLYVHPKKTVKSFTQLKHLVAALK